MLPLPPPAPPGRRQRCRDGRRCRRRRHRAPPAPLTVCRRAVDGVTMMAASAAGAVSGRCRVAGGAAVPVGTAGLGDSDPVY